MWYWVFFIVMCLAEGVYLGLKDRFGPNIIEGYRAYKRECREWDEIMARTGPRHAGGTRPDPDRRA